jgi:tRNA threonylcarbamoyladenosine biosynthesis protein TsaE
VTLRAVTTSTEDTRALAAAIAGLARPGDVILLTGDLGAGKTAFAQGFAGGLGVTEQVTSPTFTLARSYEGRLTLNHLDVYRLDHLQEAVDLGLAELVDDGGVTIIEWGEVVVPALPADYLMIRLLHQPDPERRRLELEAVGPHWAVRTDALHAVLEHWLVA